VTGGGIYWNSEQTWSAAPLLKINTNYVGFSGLSNANKITSGRAEQQCENRNDSTRNDATSSK